MNKKKVIISTIVLIIDQLTKSLVELGNVNMNFLGSFLRFHYYQNTGAAWSILEGKVTLLIIVALAMLVLVFNMMFSYEENKCNNWAFGLLLGGIIGNLIDRVFYGFVRDFIEVNLFGYGFPVFNIADTAIVVGVLLLLLSAVKERCKDGSKSKRRKRENR